MHSTNSHSPTDSPTAAWEHYTAPEQIDVRGLQTAYRRKGSGDAIVYLHGEGLARRWLPLFEHLTAFGDVVVPAHPGFGETPLPTWLKGFDDLVMHYDEMFDLLRLDRIHLVGHGVGAWAAAEFATWYPKRVTSLTLISPLGLRVPGHPPTDSFRFVDDDRAMMLFNGDPEPYQAYLEDGDETETRIHRYLEATGAGRLMWNPRYNIKLDRRLGRVSAPALIVEPDEDRQVPAEHFLRWAELLPDARTVHLHGTDRPTGHGVIVQEPEALASEIGRFIHDCVS
jgi:pimeloyl-ACP methyl ester carboxylesterase